MWQKIYPPGSRRGNDRFVVRGKDKFGAQYEVILPTTNPRIARSLGRQYEESRNCNPPPAPEPVAPAPVEIRTFRLAVERYIDFRRPSKADLARLARILAFTPEDGRALADMPIEACGQGELVTLARSAFAGCVNATLNREALRPYAAVLHYAHNPLGWRPDITLRAFAEDEVERQPARPADVALLIANVERAYPSPHGIQKDRNAAYKTAFLLLLWERGLRLSDNLRLKRERDLDLPNGRIRVTIGKARNKVKWLPISRELVSMLATLAPCEADNVFPWATKSGVYKWLRPLVGALNIEFTPHQARHAFATDLLEAAVDAKIVQDLGGWSSFESVRRTYQHVREPVMRAADTARRRMREGVK